MRKPRSRNWKRERIEPPMPHRPHRDVITVKEAAAILDVSDCTVRRWLKRGYLDGLKYERAVRVFEDSVLAFIDRSRMHATRR